MFRDNLLSPKRILITGGGTGLGKAMAHRFLQLGATVYICGRREDVLEKTAAELSPQGPIHRLPCDVRNLDAVESMIDAIWKSGPLDVLVNNAAGNFIARTEELSPRAFESVIGIVLFGTLHCHHGLRTPLAQILPFRHRLKHLGNLRPSRLGLCGSLCCLQGRSRSPDPQPRRRVGQSRHPHERHRSRPNSYPRSIFSRHAAPRTRNVRARA